MNKLVISVESCASPLSTRRVSRGLRCMKKEEWKEISGYEGLYFVSDLGRVKNRMGKILKLYTNIHRKNYVQVSLCKNAIHKNFKIYRLVAQAFIPNKENKPQINHKNGDKSDNTCKNLEWVNQSENTAHAIKIGLTPKWEKHPSAKLTRKKVLEIRNKFANGTKATDLMKKYKMSQTVIYMIINNQLWKM